jgi:carboxyl-terminal processing protease
VLDLRGNAGGVISEAVRSLAALGCVGEVGRARDRGGKIEVLRASARPDAYRGPLMVLVDGASASASELFASAVQDSGRGAVVGARSYGKGVHQSLIHLSSPLGASLGALQVTSRELQRAGGRPLQGRGVTPDLAVSSDDDA